MHSDDREVCYHIIIPGPERERDRGYAVLMTAKTVQSSHLSSSCVTWWN